jgi:hypothetical protein
MRYLLSLLLVATACSGLLTAGTPEAPRPGELESLIKRLGARDYEVREEAQLKLAAYGEAARAVLTKAAKSADPEVSASAARLLDKINRAVVAVRVVDSAEKPVAEAPVVFNIYRRDGRRSTMITRNEMVNTDADGWACIGNLKPGGGYILNVRCQMPDYVPTTISQPSIELKVKRHEFKIVALRCAHVTGTLLGKDDVPLTDCGLGLVPSNRLRMLENPKQARFALRRVPMVTTDENGEFVFEQVHPGEYAVVLMEENKVLYKSEMVEVEAEETLKMGSLATKVDPRALKRDDDVLDDEDGAVQEK